MLRTKMLVSVALTSALIGAAAQPARAQDAPRVQENTSASPDKPTDQGAKPASDAENEEKLRKAAQNPVASLISVPIQENWNFNIGSANRTQNVMNIQPVIPLSASANWNLIIRWIAPVIYQPFAVNVPQPPGPPVQVQSGVYGLGDMQPSFFLAPKKTSKLIWGVGPQLLLPTATNTTTLGQGKFGVGPTAVVLVQPGKWTLGFLVSNVWSVAGHSNLPDVNQFLLQYFINYNLPKGWYLTWQPSITANWEMKNGGRWVVPFGGGIGRIMKLGAQPVNLSLQFYGNGVHPPGASPWTLRMSIAFLFPKKPSS
jgi:hypothetical protein